MIPVIANSGIAATTTLTAATRAVVDVNTSLAYQGASAAGTGMVLSRNGYILTNNHVIRGSTSIQIRDVGNGHTYTATLVGYDVAEDVAVLRLVRASGLWTIPIGSSKALKPGASVTAIGNAEGRGGAPSVARGKVIGLNQSVTAIDESTGITEHLKGLIATNAAIVSGDSGGPLVNANGKVVGMVTAGSTSYELRGVVRTTGYAIPIETARTIASRIEKGRFSGDIHPAATAFLGVNVVSSAYSTGSAYRPGALVVSVVQASPAQAAELNAGDLITSIGGKAVSSLSSLTNILLTKTPGTRVTLVWIDRLGTSHSTSVVLANGPPL